MRYAVISDIHSNLEALNAFLEAIESLEADKIICLGDIVGYNPNPNECIDILKQKGVRCVLGNHDSRVAGFEEPTDFNYHAASAVYWTRDVITAENMEFLRQLPRKLLVNNKFAAFHGWLNDTDRYIIGARDAEKNFELMKELKATLNVSFFGHTHVPVAYSHEDGIILNPENPVKLKKNVRYLINPGGLGQPRDRDPRAAFLIYDSKRALVTFYRVEYDIDSTADKILAAGLPERLAERLKLGW